MATLTTPNFENFNYDFVPNFGAEPLLNARDEVELSDAIQAWKTAESTPETENPQRRAEIIAAGKKAQDRFVTSNVRLVTYLAQKQTGRGLPYADLVQEGALGLMHALTKFDPARGFRFSTYATPWIKQYMGRAANNMGATIRVPEHAQLQMRQLAKAGRDLSTDLGRDATAEELAAELDVPVARVETIWSYARQPISLNIPIGEEGAELGDLIEDESTVTPERFLDALDVSAQVSGALSSLSETEREVINLRFGFTHDGDTHTLDKVGVLLGLSRERVRQVESKAIAKLRHPAHAGLRDLLST